MSLGTLAIIGIALAAVLALAAWRLTAGLAPPFRVSWALFLAFCVSVLLATMTAGCDDDCGGVVTAIRTGTLAVLVALCAALVVTAVDWRRRG